MKLFSERFLFKSFEVENIKSLVMMIVDRVRKQEKHTRD